MKYRIQREGLSMTITAQSREEAELDFAERLKQRGQRVERLKGEGLKRGNQLKGGELRVGKGLKGGKQSTRGNRGHGR